MSPRRPHRRSATVAVVVTAATALAGCGAGNGGAASAPEPGRPPPPPTAAPTPAPPPAAFQPPSTAPAPPTTAPSPWVAPPLEAVPVPSPDAAALAARLVTAETAIADPATTPAALAAAAHDQQAAYRQLVDTPAWDTDVLGAVPADLRPVVEANLTAGRELARLVRRPQERLPAWEIVDPAAAEALHAHYLEAEATFGVPWPYLAAIHLIETRMGRIRGTSSAGAQGPMQFLPSTWAAYGEGDINDTRDAILGAARYLRANGAPDDMGNALYRYNPTPRYVRAATLYAEQIEQRPRAFLAYYHWEVYYATTLGDVHLPVGYHADEPRPVTPADVPVADVPVAGSP